MKTLKINDADFITVIQILSEKGIKFEFIPEKEEISLTPIPTKVELPKETPPIVSTPTQTIELTTNKCLQCGREFVGRTDKKFCSNVCRSAYNNHKYKTENNENSKDNKNILLDKEEIAKKLKSSKTTIDFVVRILDIVPTKIVGRRYLYNQMAIDQISCRIEQAYENLANITFIKDDNNYFTTEQITELFNFLKRGQINRYLQYFLAKRYRIRSKSRTIYYDSDAVDLLKKFFNN